MPRLVRRTPLSERIKAYLDPWDFLLWLSEELNSNDWDDFLKEWAIPFGLGINFVFLIARANSSGTSSGGDDVFGDYEGQHGSSWLAWFSSFVVHFLTLVSVTNGFYTFWRKRHYRLFENNIEIPPTTPSARRVRVDSSPMSSSPLRFLTNALASTTAESRAHPDEARDVWELAVWDPTPLCLRLFCLFSPGHVLVCWLFLPIAPLDPRPSVTVVTTIVIGSLLSVQLYMLQARFSQQSKDSALIHKEVFNEYDTKFVHPSLNRPVRDVGIQTPTKHDRKRRTTSPAGAASEIDTYTPTTIVNRGFRTNPNPAYASQYDPDNQMDVSERLSRATGIGTPPNMTPFTNGTAFSSHTASSAAGPDHSSPIRGPPAHARPMGAPRQPQFRPSTNAGDGGSLGVYSHAASPLRKTASANYLRENERHGGGYGNRQRAASPAKRTGEATGLDRRFGALRAGGERRDSGRF